MTFATRVKTIKEDLSVFQKFCSGRHPMDFHLFCDLILYKGRKLVSPIPGVSTHGETEQLSKFINWEKVFWDSLAPRNIFPPDTV